VAHPFREAVEARDLNAVIATLAPDVVFRSPVVFKPYEGRELVSHMLSLAIEVFDDFEYVDELHGDDTVGLVFKARVGDKQIDGWDRLRLDSDGRVKELIVMVRPMSATIALAEAMGAKLEQRPAPAAAG
jgi:hypothetical protein